MYAGRLANVLRRQWQFITAVLCATLLGAIAWNIWGPGIYMAQAEVLVAAKIPAGAQLGQYDVEFSRASTSDFIVDDLSRVVEGNAFAGLVAAKFLEATGRPVSKDELTRAFSSDRTHRGLKLILRWRDSGQAALLIGLAAKALTEESSRFYPTLPEVADLAIIHLASSATRPGILVSAFDVILKLAVAAFFALAIVVWWDRARGRLYSEDVEDLLGLKVLAKIE